MSAHFDVDTDAFALCRLTFGGAEYCFRPATLRDQIEYLDADIRPRFGAANTEGERNKILIEVICKYIQGLSESLLLNATLPQLWAIYRFVVDGTPPEASGKN